MRVLMVCLGNICRSPLAEGVLQVRAAAAGLDWTVDSAATSGWHDGSPPDPRSIAAALRHGIDIRHQRARRVTAEDFSRFHLICAMDTRILAVLERMRPAGSAAEARLLMDFAPQSPIRVVADPYYEGDEAFDATMALIEEAVAGLIAARG